MTDLSITAADVAPVRVIEKESVPAAAAMDRGIAVYLNSSGHAAKADGSAAGTAGCVGICISKATSARETITYLRKGVVDLGDALDALAFGASVYLSDTDSGILADAAGTVSVVVGKVVPGHGATTADKLLRVDL